MSLKSKRQSSYKNDSICRDVKTQKVCEQGRDG